MFGIICKRYQKERVIEGKKKKPPRSIRKRGTWFNPLSLEVPNSKKARPEEHAAAAKRNLDFLGDQLAQGEDMPTQLLFLDHCPVLGRGSSFCFSPFVVCHFCLLLLYSLCFQVQWIFTVSVFVFNTCNLFIYLFLNCTHYQKKVFFIYFYTNKHLMIKKKTLRYRTQTKK